MRAFINKNRLLSCVMALGLVVTLILCVFRIGLEAKDTQVCAVMTPEGLSVLAEACGADAQELAQRIGVQVFDGQTLDGVQVLTEDANQYSFDPALGGTYVPGNSVRAFRLTAPFSARYAYLGYSGAEEIGNMLYRAVTERNIRVVWLEPIYHSLTGELISDPEVYASVLTTLGERISAHGLILGEDISILPDYEPDIRMLFLAGLFPMGAACLLLLLCIPALGKKKYASAALVLLGIVAQGAVCFLFPALYVSLLAFLAGVVFPCLALWRLLWLETHRECASLGQGVGVCAGATFSALGIALLGGLSVGALQSGSAWLLAINNFRGVKLSQALPLLFALWLSFQLVCSPRELLKAKKTVLLGAAVVLVLATAIFLLRSGNAAGAVTVFEQRFRNLLENLLITRPRTKEFLIAWPCAGICLGLLLRGKRQLAWPFSVLCVTGLSSVVNTFCHSRAPLWLSSVRGILGALIGCCLAMVLLCILHCPGRGGSERTE